METGRGIATPRDIRDLYELYEVADESERDRMMRLAREGRQQGWWQSYDLDFDRYVGLEEEAIGVKYYQSTIVPGLLQTPGYARAMLEVSIPKLAPPRIDELLEVKLTRQLILTREPPLHLWAVLDEAALHRVVGGPAVMAAQLDRLINVTSRPNVTMQVIPYEAGAHPAMDSTFNILDFGRSVPGTVYVEGLVGWIYLDRQVDIKKYQQVFDYLSKIALNPKESIDLAAQIRREYQHE